MIDNVKTTADGKKNIDNVSGFSITQIEKAFYNSSSMNDLKSYLKKNYPSGKGNRKYSSEQLDQLFNYWINL